jgi:hypothetical protein
VLLAAGKIVGVDSLCARFAARFDEITVLEDTGTIGEGDDGVTPVHI